MLLRGYFHGTKLEKRTAVASVAMREAVKHWYVVCYVHYSFPLEQTKTNTHRSKCNETLQKQVEQV